MPNNPKCDYIWFSEVYLHFIRHKNAIVTTIIKSTLHVSISFSDFFEDNVLIILINLLKFNKELLQFFVFPFDIICPVLAMLLLQVDGLAPSLPLPALPQATVQSGRGPVISGRHVIRSGRHLLSFSYLQITQLQTRKVK